MAIYGRRQPHAPIILVGAKPPPAPPPPPAAAQFVLRGRVASQAAADRYFRRSFGPKVIRSGGRPAVGQVLAVFLIPVQTAAIIMRRRPYPPLLQPLKPPVAPAVLRYFIKT